MKRNLKEIWSLKKEDGTRNLRWSQVRSSRKNEAGTWIQCKFENELGTWWSSKFKFGREGLEKRWSKFEEEERSWKSELGRCGTWARKKERGKVEMLRIPLGRPGVPRITASRVNRPITSLESMLKITIQSKFPRFGDLWSWWYWW